MAQAPAKAVSPPTLRRRVLRVLGVTGAILCLLLLASLAALHTPTARRFVLSQVTQVLAAQQIELRADELSYNLFDLSATLRNVRVRSAQMEHPPFLAVARARVDLRLVQLLWGRYLVESAVAEGLDIHYVVDENGRDNLPHPPQTTDQPRKPIDYLLADLSVPNARIRYENRAQQIDLTVPAASLSVKGNPLTDRHDVALSVSEGVLRVRDRRARLDRLSGKFDLGRDDLRIERADLDAEGSRTELRGEVKQFDDPRANLTLRGQIDPGRVALVANLQDPIAGTIQLEATAKGPFSALTIDTRVTGSDLKFRDIEHVELAAAARYDMGRRQAQVSQLQVRAPWGSIEGEGAIALEGAGESRVRASIESLDALALMQALALPYRAATRVDARVAASWPGLEFLRAAGEASAVLTPTPAGSLRSALTVGGRLDVIAREDRTTAQLVSLHAAGVQVNGVVGLVDRERIEGNVRANAADLAQVVSNAETFLGRPRGSLLPTPVAGPMVVEGRLGGTVDSPSVSARLVAPALNVGGATGIAVSSDAAYTPEALTIDRIDVAWQDASAQAAGRVELQGERRLDLQLGVDALEIPALLGAVKKEHVPASGTVSIQGIVAGTTVSPRARLQVQGTNLAAYSEALGTLAATIQLTDRQVDLTELELDKPQPDGNGRLIASGSYHLEEGSYRIDLQSENLRLVSLTLPDGRQVRGEVALAGNGQGTTQAPSADIDLSVDGLQLGDYDLGRVVVDATVENQQAKLNASAERFRAEANVVMGVARPYPATLEALVNDLDLATLPIKRETPLGGLLRARMNASGELARPESARADLTVDAFSGTWNDQPFGIDGPAVLRYADERLAIDWLRLTAQDSTVSVSGVLPWTDRAGQGALDIDARANLATLAQYAPAGTRVSSNGAVSLTGTIRGTLRVMDPDVVLTVDDALIQFPDIAPGISNLTARARVSGGEANLERLTASWGAARFDASARLPLDLLPELPVDVPRKGGPATVRASLEGLDPASVPGAPAGLSGRISATAEASASRPDLTALEGRLLFHDLQVAFDNLTLEQTQPSAIRVADGSATIEQFELSGSVGTLTASGAVGLVEPRPLDVDARGDFDLAAMSVVTDAVRAEGATTLELAAKGSVAAPDVSGFVSLANANIVVDEPGIAAEGLSARVDLAGSRVTLTELAGKVNGGALTGSGTVTLGDGGVQDVDLQFSTDDFAFDAPLELRSVSDSTVRINRRGDEFVVDGQVTIQEAGLTSDINLDTGLLAAMTTPRRLDLTEKRHPLVERVRFNLNVDTATPVLVDNNLARAEVTADLRVLGTPYETGLSGRLSLREGGEITLNERQYEVERGDITFIDERRIFPSFDLRLNTSAGHYDIALAVTGTPGDTETTLTSDPVLPEPDIMALLITGRTLDEMRGEEFDVAREQVLSLLTGRVGSTVGRGIERATGLTEVRIEPNMIASETDPSARLTVGQDITEGLALVYSTDLTDSNDQIWVAQYDLTRRFQTRAVRQSDNSYRLDFRHDVRVGGRPAPQRLGRQRPVVAGVQVPGDAGVSETELRHLLGIDEGDAFDFFAARRGVQKIEELYRERGWLQSRVRLDREGDEKTVNLSLAIITGPKVDVQFSGVTPPSNVREEVHRQWHRGVFDTQRAEDSAKALRAWLMQERYLDAKVDYTIQDVSAEERRVVFRAEPGTRFQKLLLVFEGAAGIDAGELNDIIEEQRLERQLFTDPVVVTELLERYYREQGYLTAEIRQPRYEFDGSLARAVLEVREGPKFTIQQVSTSGNAVIATPTLLAELPVVAGDPFLPAVAERALERIRELYWQRAYNDVRSDYQLTIDRDAGQVGVDFTIDEGRASIVADVVIEGNDRTSEQLVREQLELTPSQPLDLSALSRSRKNLYDTGAFSIVDITRENLEGDLPAQSTTTSGPDHATGTADEKPVQVQVAVTEVQPYRLRYGASYDTERGPGGLFEISNHNSLGKARVVGLSARLDSQLSEGRVYMSQPSLRYWPIKTTVSVYYREEQNPATDVGDAFDVDRRGVSIQQERQLGNSYVWSYGYRYERARTFDPLPGGMLNQFVTVSPLTSTFTREGRDEVFDASRGSFVSQAFSYSPSWLGSDLSFIKYYGQNFHYFPLQAARRKRFTNEILRPRLVYAVGVRLGLAHGFDGLVPASERFYAGGSTTLRGFAQNAVGPIGPDRIPTGGEALLVVNNELRFPLVSIVDGVVFADVGNVFARVSDFSFADMRESAGVGLRLRTPWFLVRGDYGFVLDPRPGERRGRFFFSIGQAF
jgi:outer membrane protein assembly complex protein YaeT